MTPDKPWRLMPWMTTRLFRQRLVRLGGPLNAIGPAALVLLLMCLAIVILAGCSSGPTLTAGHVTGKEADPGYYYTYLQPITTEECEPVGQSEDCTTMITGYIPLTYYQPPDWKLYLKAGKLTGWTYVTPDQFAIARIGQWWGSRNTARPAPVQTRKP